MTWLNVGFPKCLCHHRLSKAESNHPLSELSTGAASGIVEHLTACQARCHTHTHTHTHTHMHTHTLTCTRTHTHIHTHTHMHTHTHTHTHLCPVFFVTKSGTSLDFQRVRALQYCARVSWRGFCHERLCLTTNVSNGSVSNMMTRSKRLSNQNS